MEKINYIAVAGTIGVGKTTAARILADCLDFHLVEENWEDNRFLPRFYKNMPRWALASQTFFLLEKIKQTQGIKNLLKNKKQVVQDTPVMQDVLSYAKAQFVLGNMDEAEFGLYTKTYSMFVKSLPCPDLIIYLDASVDAIEKRLRSRAREFEKKIPESYIKLLDELNRQWVRKADHNKILRIATEKLDFVSNKADIDKLTALVKNKLGLKSKDLFDGQLKELGRARVILMCGMPGSGKSTIAKKLSSKLGMRLIVSDIIREKVFKSLRYDSRGDMSVLNIKPKYYALMFEKMKMYLLKGDRVIVDASNMDIQRIKFYKKIGRIISKKEIAVLVVKTSEKIIEERMKQIGGMANEKEDFFSGWKRVYGYYKEHLKNKDYFWPDEKEGVKIVEVFNG